MTFYKMLKTKYDLKVPRDDNDIKTLQKLCTTYFSKLLYDLGGELQSISERTEK